MNAVIERPILMSGESVRGIIDLRKTHTRRVIKPQPKKSIIYANSEDCWITKGEMFFSWNKSWKCLYGKPGDLLWVRETWDAISKTDEFSPLEECNIEYRADLPAGCTDYPGGWLMEDARGNDEATRWRPSIFMPRWASRITLKIRDVRVERLQDISEADAEKEGISNLDSYIQAAKFGHRDDHGALITKSKTLFAGYWDSINAKRGHSWDSNPWVWVIEFEKVEGK